MNPQAQVNICLLPVAFLFDLSVAFLFDLSCYIMVLVLLLFLGSTKGKRTFSSSKEIRRWFAKAFSFAVH